MLLEKEGKSLNELQTLSYRYFMKKYFLSESDRLKNLIYSQKILLSGRIYTFKYNPKFKDALDYYDRRPVALIIERHNNQKEGYSYYTAINLNFLPAKAKSLILAQIATKFKPLILQDLKRKKIRAKEVKPLTPKQQKQKLGYQLLSEMDFSDSHFFELQNAKPFFPKKYNIYKLLDNILIKVAKSNYRFALRRYIFDSKYIRNIRYISFDDWKFIPFLRTKDLIGESLNSIYKLYWSGLSKALILPKKNKKEKSNKIIKNKK